MILDNFNKDKCCGCGSCVQICPVNALSLKKDKKGFYYPDVDSTKCTHCNLCEKACDFRKFDASGSFIKSYVVRHKDINEVKTSQSGAAFKILSDYVINKKGCVFGASLLNKLTINHVKCETKEQVDKLKGSKYVQSDLKSTFKECKELLNNGSLVLYTGTPCQVHSLINYLKITNTNIDNLITAGIICHGVPSQQLWGDYIKYIEHKYHKEIIKVNFRDKSLGWHVHKESFVFNNNKKIMLDNWANAFYSHKIMRESCYHCPYTTALRECDFTIADCWGIEKVFPELDDNNGLSLLMVHTEKANMLMNNLEFGIKKEINLTSVLQPQLQYPIKKSAGYDTFWNNYFEDKNKCLKNYFVQKNDTLANKIKRFVKKILKRN